MVAIQPNEKGVHDHLVHIKWDDGDVTHDGFASVYVRAWYKMGIKHKPDDEEEEIERIKNMKVEDH